MQKVRKIFSNTVKLESFFSMCRSNILLYSYTYVSFFSTYISVLFASFISTSLSSSTKRARFNNRPLIERLS